MEWPKNAHISKEQMDKANEFLRRERGILDETSRTKLMSAKSLTHVNGFRYLGQIMAYVWIGKEKGYLSWEQRKVPILEYTKGSILDVITEKANWIKRFEMKLNVFNASSVAFYALKLFMRSEKELNQRAKRIHKVSKPKTKIMGQLAGFMFALVDGTYDSEAPDLKVGYDLVPALSKQPTPWVLVPKLNGETDFDFDFHEEVYEQAIQLRELAWKKHVEWHWVDE